MLIKTILLVMIAESLFLCKITHADNCYNSLTTKQECKLLINNNLLASKPMFYQIIGNDNGFLKDDNDNKKSFIRGVGASFIPIIGPIVGHSYIGDKNRARGICYSLFSTIFTLAGSISFDANDKAVQNSLYGAMVIHGINIVDAAISINDYNKNIKKKSYFIAIGSSAVFPAFGHIYLGGKNDVRGAVYSMGWFISSAFPNKAEVFAGIYLINIIDVAYSTYHYNKNLQTVKSNISIIPDIQSKMIRVVWAF